MCIENMPMLSHKEYNSPEPGQPGIPVSPRNHGRTVIDESKLGGDDVGL